MSQRIQLRRVKGWRKPEGAIVVARPSKWGNPFYIVPYSKRHVGDTCRVPSHWCDGRPNVNARESVVRYFRYWATAGLICEYTGCGPSAEAMQRLCPVGRCALPLTSASGTHETGTLVSWHAPFTAADVRAELRGKDLACWCPLDAPCHADVLLELANAS